MINTHIPSFVESFTEEQETQFLENLFVTFGSVFDEEANIEMRFAYERILDQGPFLDTRRGFLSHERGRVVTVSGFCEEKDLMKQLCNPYLLKIARMALGTEDIIYSDGYMFWQRLLERGDPGGWDGWHTDFILNERPTHPTHVNLWTYLDDITSMEGPTQLVQGGIKRIRENFDAGHEAMEGVDPMKKDPDHALYMEAPAGGGFCFSGACPHRATINQSGKPRRVVTYEFDVRTDKPHGRFYEVTTKEQQQQVAEWLPEEHKGLILDT